MNSWAGMCARTLNQEVVCGRRVWFDDFETLHEGDVDGPSRTWRAGSSHCPGILSICKGECAQSEISDNLHSSPELLGLYPHVGASSFVRVPAFVCTRCDFARISVRVPMPAVY